MSIHRLPRARWHRLPVVAAGAVAATLMATGTAVAYWTSTGTGTGSATAGTISLSVANQSVTGLYPGGSVTVSFDVTNTSASGALDVTGVSQDSVNTETTGCTAANVAFTPTAPLPTGIAAGGTGTVTGTVTMSAAAENACQGATFSIGLTVTGRLG